MKTNFEIHLINGDDFLKSYTWYVIPQVGDTLALGESEIFLVKSRLLPITDSNRVVLFGTLN